MIHEANEVFTGKGKGCCVDAGMEAEAWGEEEVFVEEDANVTVGVVDETKGADRTRSKAEVTLQATLGCEGELALAEAMLNGVDVHRAVAGEDDEVMSVALVVAEEEVLAEEDVVSAEVLLGKGKGGKRGVFDVVEGDAEGAEKDVEFGGTDHGVDYSVRSMRVVKRRVMTSVARLAARTTSSASLT